MKLTDQKIIEALKAGKSIRWPGLTSNDEFFLASNGLSITTKGRIFAAGEGAVLPLQLDFLDRDDWEIVED